MIELKVSPKALEMFLIENKNEILEQDPETIEKANLLKKETLVLYRELENSYYVQAYPKTKSYEIEKIYFNWLKEEESIDDQENEEQIITKKIFKKEHIWTALIIILLGSILLSNVNFSSANLKNNIWEIQKQEIIIKDDFDLLTEKINSNNKAIQEKLQLQKEIRVKKTEFDNIINKSIKEVQEIEKENLNLRNDLINLSNNLK